MRTELQVLTPSKKAIPADATGGLATVGQIDTRRRSSEAKLKMCIATVKLTNLEIDELQKLGTKKAKP